MYNKIIKWAYILHGIFGFLGILSVKIYCYSYGGDGFSQNTCILEPFNFFAQWCVGWFIIISIILTLNKINHKSQLNIILNKALSSLIFIISCITIIILMWTVLSLLLNSINNKNTEVEILDREIIDASVDKKTILDIKNKLENDHWKIQKIEFCVPGKKVTVMSVDFEDLVDYDEVVCEKGDIYVEKVSRDKKRGDKYLYRNGRFLLKRIL